MKPSTPALLLTGALVTALVFLGWSAVRLSSARDAAERAEAHLAECRRLAQAIVQNREMPSYADETERKQILLAGVIEASADQAGLSADQIDLIAHPPAQRIDDTAYLRKPTRVLAHGLTLAQTLRFIHGLTTHDPPLNIDAVRLTAPRRNESGGASESWDLDLTASYLIFRPRQSGARSATRS